MVIDRLLTAEQAEECGFCIEGQACFMYNLGNMIAILGWDSANEVWRFDTQADEDGNVWSFTEPDLITVIFTAEAIEALCQNAAVLGFDNPVTFMNMLDVDCELSAKHTQAKAKNMINCCSIVVTNNQTGAAPL